MSVETEITEIKTKTEDHYKNFSEMKNQNKEDHDKFFSILSKIDKQTSINNTYLSNHLSHHEIYEKRMWQIFMIVFSAIISIFITLNLTN